MTINDAPRAHLRACKAKKQHDVRLLSCVLGTHPGAAGGGPMGDLWARSPDGRHTWLYVLVVKYTYDSSVQALDSPGAADDARRPDAGQVSQPTRLVVSLLSKVLWVGLTLLVRNTASLLVSYRPLALSFAGACT